MTLVAPPLAAYISLLREKKMFDFMYISADVLLTGAKNSYAFLEANYERLGLPNPALTLK
jgi:hypothetical protein